MINSNRHIAASCLALSIVAGLASYSSVGETTATQAPQSDSDSQDSVPGLVFTELDAFQVVAVPLMKNSNGVPTTERVAPLVADRAAVVRAKVTVPVDWLAEEIEMRIDVTISGETTQLRSTTIVEKTSDSDDPDSGLFINIPARLMVPEASYVASLWRPGATPALARYPENGEATLAPQVTGTLKVRIIPYRVAGRIPDTSQTALDAFRDTIYAYYPVSEVEISVGELQENPVPGAPISDVIGSVLVDVGMLMENDPELAPADTYFYGLAAAAGRRDDFNGRTGTSQELDLRGGFAAGMSFDNDPLNASTLVHELGHLHYLKHAPCGSVDPSSLDINFPHTNGMANTEGYDVRTGTFIAKDSSGDLMSYCQPRWISTYHYARLASWIEQSRSW